MGSTKVIVPPPVLLDQSFQTGCHSSLPPSVVDRCFRSSVARNIRSPQLSVSSLETGFAVSAAESDKFPLLLDSSVSFPVASAASFASLSSSETKAKWST